MKTTATLLTTAAAVTVCVFALIAFSENQASAATAPADATRLEHGRYLVHRVGMCIDCHSPRDEKGEFIESRHLHGAPIPFAPTVEMPWNGAAPRIAGLPAGFTAADTVHFLITGERPNGRPPPLPPMPPYRFDRDDAEAIVAYLSSLRPADLARK